MANASRRGLGPRLFAVAKCEPDFAALPSFAIAAPLFRRFQDERRNYLRKPCVLVNRNKGDVGGGGMLALSGEHIFGINLDAYFHRSVEGSVDLGFQHHDFAEIHGFRKSMWSTEAVTA